MRYQVTNIAVSPRVHYDRRRKPVYFAPGDTKVIDIEQDDVDLLTERMLVGLDWKIKPAEPKAAPVELPPNPLGIVKPHGQATDHPTKGVGPARSVRRTPVEQGPNPQEPQLPVQPSPGVEAEPAVGRGKAYKKNKLITEPEVPQKNIHFNRKKAAANLLTDIATGIGFFALRKRASDLIEVNKEMTKADIIAALKQLAE